MNVSKRTILAINGSASKGSSNLRLIEFLASQNSENFTWEIVDDLSQLPHFSPELSLENTPESILAMRNRIESADAILICTPEYIFSIPSGLKNPIEWCVSTVIFDKKPLGIITASASGEKGHEELELIMRTVGAVFMPETTLLIQGIKGKIDAKGVITDDETVQAVRHFLQSFTNHVTILQFMQMDNVQFRIVKADNDKEIALIAAWYLEEWGIAEETTRKKISECVRENNEFQVLLSLGGTPTATAGIYTHVSLLDKEPRFRAFQPWLALVYTVPEMRGKGLGAVLCEYIEQYAQMLGLKQIYLFTHTAERLYKRLGWQELERLPAGGKDIVIMKKNLSRHQ